MRTIGIILFSLLFYAGSFAQAPDLGPDRTVCAGETEILDAGSGFDSYLWNNGLTTQSIEVSVPGTYWVETELNGNTYSDTVTIAFYPFSEGEANIWYFGYFAGLDFNTNPPTALPDGQLFTYEGCATISNRQGQLLFYTDGSGIRNANHEIMPNGSGLLGDFSSTQSGVVVPRPGSDSLYYVFTADDEAGPNGLRYSLVDMSLDNGKGDVTLRNALIEAPMTEKVTAVRHSNNVDVWVIAHRWNSNEFTAYLVTSNGLNTSPIVSAAGTVHTGEYHPVYQPNARGYMKSSTDGSRLSVAIPFMNTVELFDFDNTTGEVSYFMTIPFSEEENPYGVEFSPDGTKLYATIFQSLVFQYDLQAGSPSAIVNSRTTIGSFVSFRQAGALQLAPNGVIYVARDFKPSMPAILNPNALGISCDFKRSTVNLSSGKRNRIGFPNFIQSYFHLPDFSYQDVCLGQTTQFSFFTPTENVDSVHWDFDDAGATSTLLNPEHTFSTTGTFNVELIVYQSCQYDTIIKPVTVSEPPAPDLGNDTTICYATTLQLDAGQGDNYVWDPPTSSSNMQYCTIDTAGIYSVTVINGSGCSASDTIEIFTYPVIETELIAANASCNYNSDGAIDLEVSGGLEPYSYLWSNGATTQDITNLGAGMYSITVTDANSCEASDSTEIFDSPIINFNLTPITCHNDNNAQVELIIENGIPPYDILWENGATSPVLSNLAADTLSVTVTDTNGCFSTDSVIIINPDPMSINFYVSHVSCHGNNNGAIGVGMNGGTFPYYSFVWSNDSTSWGISFLEAGTYSVAVTDTNGCVLTASTEILEPPALLTTTEVTDIPCNGGDVGAVNLSVIGGTAPYFYLWSNGETTQDINNLSSGTYIVETFDANGCTQSDTAEVTDLSIQVEETIGAASCTGGSDGFIDITVSGGTEPYTFLWSNGDTTEDISGLSPGFYTVTITDALNCIEEFTYEITQETLEYAYTVTPVSCFGGNDGAIDLSISNGVAPYSFSWSNGATTEDITGLEAGTYTVEVTDSEGCSGSFEISVTQPQTIVTEIVVTNIPCNAGNVGAIDLTVAGGTPAYTFLWSNGATTEDISGLAAGTYSVIITDANDCQHETQAQVTELELSVSAETENINCAGGSNGTIDISVSGGTAPYSFVWSNGATTEDLTGISAGTYTVTITDASGCTTEQTFTLTEPDGISISNLMAENTNCANTTDGTVTATASGGTPPYLYSVNGTVFQTSALFENLAGGNYWFWVQDANYCIDSLEFTIETPSGITVQFDSLQTIQCNGDNNGEIYVSASGGTGNLSFALNNGSQQNNGIFTALPPGAYEVTVTDENNCTAAWPNILITEPPPLFIDSIVTIDIDCSQTGSNAGSILLSVSGGTPPFLFSMNDSIATETGIFTALPAGNYTVEITDSHQCRVVAQATINAADCISSLEMPNVFSPNSDGYNDVFMPSAQNIRVFTAEIYNRWGKLLYTWHNPDTGWDGKIDGKNTKASHGVYYYIVKAVGEDAAIYELNGFFHLVE